MRLLIWEKNPLQQQYLQRITAAWDYQVECVTGYKVLRQVLERYREEVCLVLIAESSLNHYRQLQKLQEHAPLACLLVVHTAQDSASHGHVLEAGADMCLVRPFSESQLLTACAALTRHARRVWRFRQGIKSTSTKRYGDFVFSFADNTVMYQEQPLALNERTFTLLHYFCEHPGVVHSRQKLSLVVWQKDVSVGRQVDNLVGNLRKELYKQLSDIFSGSIKNRYGKGYVFYLS